MMQLAHNQRIIPSGHKEIFQIMYFGSFQIPSYTKPGARNSSNSSGPLKPSFQSSQEDKVA